jgi:glycosyltransferase involved in cell wall biosynthesis
VAKLSLTMIVKNEENRLSKCLDSVKEIVDEIILVDTGSTDKTKIIAESYGAKVFDFKWNSNFSEARNYALSKSTGDWILYLDADEYLARDSSDELLSIIRNKKLLGIKCTVHSISTGKIAPVLMRYTRLFKNNSEIKFSGRVHEQIDESLEILGYEFIDSNITIYHTGYDVSENELKDKAERNLKLLLKDFSINESSYTAYQIANSYSILELQDNAYKYYAIALKKNDLANDYKIIAYTNIAGYEFQKWNFDIAKQHIDKALSYQLDDPNLLLTAAKIYSKFNLPNDSLLLCSEAMSINEKLIKGKLKPKLVAPIINPLVIIYNGIYLSCLFGSEQYLNEFVDTLENVEIQYRTLERKRESEIIKKIVNNSTIDENSLTELGEFINENSLEAYLILFEKFLSLDQIIPLMEKKIDKFSENPEYLMQLGNAYLASDQNSRALNIYNKLISLKNFNPSVYFYMVSIFIKTNKKEKILPLLKNAKEKFAFNEQLINSLNELENKLSPIS